MAGWLILTGRQEALEPSLHRFHATFSVPGVPSLTTSLHSIGPRLHLLLWAWSPLADVDATLETTADGRELLLVDGYLAHGVPERRQGSATPLLDRWRRDRVELLRSVGGSFAMVHVDGVTGEVCLATDRIASRAVWVVEHGDDCMAGNSPAALAIVRRHQPTLNPAGVWALFATSRPVGSQGLYRGLRSLRGGELITLRGGAQRTLGARRWSDDRYRAEQRTPREWGQAIGEALTRSSARLAAVTRDPNVFLSGGLDSRLAAAALAGRATAVTLTSSGRNMNVRIAQRVAARVGAEHRVIERTATWYIDSFPAAALMAGGNYSLRHAHYVMPVQMIRSTQPEATFLLGDMLENFNKHYFKTVNGVAPRFVPGEIARLYPRLYSFAHPEPARLRRLFRPEIVRMLEESWSEELSRFSAELRDVSEDDRDCFDMLFRWSNCGLCPTYLMFECIRPLASDRNLMCDSELLDLYFRVPAAVRGSGVLHRETLRFFGNGLGRIPDSNYWLPPSAPVGLKKVARRVRPVVGRLRRRLRRPSRRTGPVGATEGSWHMLPEWYRKDARHQRFVEACLFDPSCLPAEIFDPDAIRTLWRDFLAGGSPHGKAMEFEVDMLLAFGLLQRQVPASALGN